MPSLPTGTVTFLFTDIEGSTRLLQQLGDRYADVLMECRRLVRAAVQEGGGQEVDTEGDAVFVAFASARQALLAAATAQQGILRHPWPDGAALRVRMGLHTGEARVAEGGYVGMDVHRAARICAAAHGGQILLSDTTHALVAKDLPERVSSLRDLGEHRLKDLTHPHHLFQVVAADLPADFPRIRSLDALPNNLPRQLTSFIGREKEMAEVKRLLSTAYLVTLTGSGGAGKTRLALQVVADVVEGYPDGVWLAEFAAIADPVLVPKTVASALNVPEQPGREMTDTLVEALRSKALLLVLDNCEHLLAACADMAAALLRACPKVRILATSREGLGVPGEMLWRVPSLAVPEDLRHLPPSEELVLYDAVRLFVDRAVATAPGFTVTRENAPAMAQVCQRLDGIPLAIELAAARVKVLAVEQIAVRLDDRFRLLTGGSRIVLPRQQTLRAAIDWSYNLLTEPERVLLRRLSVFAGGGTLEAAESVCVGGRVDAAGILDLLTSLVDKSLVIAEPHGGETRYRLLETVRQYGRDRLAESGETDEIRGHHRDWYREFAELAEPKLRTAEQDVWIPRLEMEHDNLRGALTWSLAEMRAATGGKTADADGLRLAGALWWFWFIGGHFSEGRRWFEQVLAMGEGAPSSLRARGLLGQGVLTFMLGDLSGGTALLEESLRLSQAAKDRLGAAWATGWLAVPAAYGGDHERALTYLHESLILWRQLGDPWGIAWKAWGLGSVLAAQGEAQRSVSLFNEALTLCRKVGDKWVTALALHYSAYWAIARGETEGVTPLVEESLSLFRALGARREIPRALGNLGLIAHARCDYGRAAAAFCESLALFREVGDKRGIALCFERLARVAGDQRRLTKAARLFGASEALREVAQVVSSRAVEFGGGGDRATIRAEMGDDAFEAAQAEGRAMTLEQAIEYALSDEAH